MSSLRGNYSLLTESVNQGVFDSEQESLDKGNLFITGFSEETLGSSGIIYLAVTVGSTDFKHEQIVVSSTSEYVVVEFFYNAVFSSGQVLPAFNANNKSANVAQAQILLNPTVSNSGTKLTPNRILRGVSGQGNNLGLSAAEGSSMFIYQPSSRILIKFTNKGSAGALDVYLKFSESPQITA